MLRFTRHAGRFRINSVGGCSLASHSCAQRTESSALFTCLDVYPKGLNHAADAYEHDLLLRSIFVFPLRGHNTIEELKALAALMYTWND